MEIHCFTDIYDHSARYYYPAIGRCMGMDPLAEWAPDITPYRYGFNNPVLYTDPDGLFETKKEARKYRRSNNLRGKIKRSTKGGEYSIHLKGSDGRITRNSETGKIDYAAVSNYTGPSIRPYKPNRWERFENANYATGLVYGILNDAWLTTQRLNPFDVHTTHLSGDYASKDEYTMGLVNTYATVIPVGRGTTIVKSVTPTGITLASKLNAAQFSKTFKGTALARAHPRIRGRLNRLLNQGVDQVNKIETGNILISGSKMASNLNNE